MQGDYATIREAAESLGVKEVTVYDAVRTGRLPVEIIFGRKVIRRDELEAYRKRSQPTGFATRGRPRKQKESVI